MKRPNQGAPQGNGMGPPGWSLISTPCLESLRKRGFGVQINLTVLLKIITFVGCACVDDADQVETAKCDGENTEQTLII